MVLEGTLIALLSVFFILVVHEGFHFVVAKKKGLPVKEFGIGYPPRLFSFYWKGTRFSLNLLPFGGYVLIPNQDLERATLSTRLQVIGAGLVSFWLISFLLLSFSFWAGVPKSSLYKTSENSLLTIVQIKKNWPAQRAGLEVGDRILGEKTPTGLRSFYSVEEFVKRVNEGVPLSLLIQKRNGETKEITVVPQRENGKYFLGIGLSFKEVYKEYFWGGIKRAGETQLRITESLWSFLKSLWKGEVREARIVGPVGVVGYLQGSWGESLGSFLWLLGVIIFNLFIFNSLPFIPVTDGGRIARELMGSLIGISLSPRARLVFELFFFALLLAIMMVATLNDIKNWSW